ncbi:MAG: 23S rRNA (adenine(2503)-C(2))-methyltransferase RlmN [Thermodesulfobacteria bacterium]|nr:23S rRNA (adenine(2503)-C(2))-methyltransferase RlmN [Thermodesulfobacteriota bacterium]
MDLRALELHELRELFKELGEPSYRGEQVFHWITCREAISFHEMTDLPKSLRSRLSELFSLELPEVIETKTDVDGTTKFAIKLKDGEVIESVLIPERDHYTLCVSTQVGCPIGCKFCLTGTMGFKRNLTTGEIISQVVIGRRYVKEKELELPLRNIVFMGMGEPLLNYENLLKALKILAHPKGFNYSKKRLTVSTVGIIEKIKKLAKDFPTALAISLHAPFDDLRRELIPIAVRYSVKDLIEVCREFPRIKNSRITVEYVLLRGINTDLKCAKRLAELLKGKVFKVNLIPFNPHPELPFERPTEEEIEAFQRYLLDRGILTTIRKSKGLNIRAACGQLRAEIQSAFN